MICLYCSSAPLISRWFFTLTLLPVPVSPVQHTWPPCSSSCSISQSWRTVSTVGTQIALYCASFGMLKREFGSTHVVHWHDLHENLKSYMFESVGGVIDAVLLECFATS